MTNLPKEGMLLENLVIEITLTGPSGAIQNFEVRTDVRGQYQLENPFLLNEHGDWQLMSNFAGNERWSAAQSVPFTFNVIRGISKITFGTKKRVLLGTEIEILGELESLLEGELSNQTELFLYFNLPDHMPVGYSI